MHTQHDQTIAITGLGCRVPGAQDPIELWDVLRDGRQTIGTLPDDRFAMTPADGIYTSDGGFLKDPWGFDTEFFGLSPREAHRLDPQHRQLLEVAAEALADSGLRTTELRRTGRRRLRRAAHAELLGAPARRRRRTRHLRRDRQRHARRSQRPDLLGV